MSTYLCIAIDTTGSMGSWIATLNKMIPQFIRISALTGSFKKICVVSYKDYDSKPVVTSTGWTDPDNLSLITFSKSLVASGGGGTPEAVKTCFYHILETLPEGLDGSNDKIYLLHLTDAPAHESSSGKLDSEGECEFAALGEERFDWNELTQEFLLQPIVYNCLSTCRFNLYASLAMTTNGFYISTSINSLENDILGIFNGWFGAEENLTFDNQVIEQKKKSLWPSLEQKRDSEVVNSEVDLIKYYSLVTQEISIVQPELASGLSSAVTRLGVDTTYTNMVFNLFEQIIRDDILTITSNKIFGKIWRKICSMRKEPKRDELIQLIETCKKSLATGPRTKFDSWLKESYNMIEEIRGELEDMVQQEKVDLNGCIEFMRDIGDKSEPADMVGLLRSLGAADQAVIKNIYARIVINPMKRFDLTNSSGSSLPLKISVERLFSLILHLVAPGTKFSGRRLQAILAMLALGTVLDTQAREFLTKFKGTWLNFAIDSQTKPEIPENFQVKFLYLCVGPGKEFLTPQELEIITKLTKLTLCNRIPEMNVNVETEIFTSMDGVRPDHHTTCSQCSLSRPISLMSVNGMTCGYCVYGTTPKVQPTPEATFMVRCSGCNSFYSRDRGIHIMGKSLCHECAKGFSPVNQTCRICSHKFVTRLDNGLPGGVCKPCELGYPALKPSYKTHKLTIRKLLSNTDGIDLNLINKLVGFDRVDGSVEVSSNLIEMFCKLQSIKPLDPQEIKSYQIIWSNKLVKNWDQIVDQIVEAIVSHHIERACCDLCCEPKPNSELGKACGRSGCDQVLCQDCGLSWYSENKLGHVVNVRHCGCMFCSRVPTPKVISRWWSPGAITLSRPGGLPTMDPGFYYGWCVRCRLIKPCGDRACGVEGQAPRFENFECEQCVQARIEFETTKSSTNPHEEIKSCPECAHPTIRYAGCNHISCPCGAHWCFECGGKFEYSEIYNHMNKVHGRIYANETPEFDDGYNSGYESD